LWLVNAWKAGTELSGEETQFCSNLWREHSGTYRDALDICNNRYGQDERYLAFKKAVNWQ
jgi:hypothetical protein